MTKISEMQAAPGARPLYNKDTIAATATAPGAAGIGIIRISGPGAIEVADKMVFKKNRGELSVSGQPSHTVRYGFVYDGEEPLDEVLVSVFRAPRSYTTEDTVEISCHGGAYVLRRVLSLCLKSGARLAEPGEFTKRAFLNGRIDLTEAEGVMDLISAGNEFARKNSLSALRGKILEKIVKLREEILTEAAFIESAIDDPEHYSLDDYPPALREKLRGLIHEMNRLIADSETGRVLKEGIKTVILGRPNVGKSSVLNLLTGEDTAIVTDIPGTTRDVLSSEINLKGIPLILYDTAGIREAGDKVERIGVDRSREMLKKADLVLFILDSAEELTAEDREIYESIISEGKKALILNNKTDLKSQRKDLSCFDLPVIEFSAKEETGIEELSDMIGKMFLSDGSAYREEVYITQARQVESLRAAVRSLELVIKSIDDKMTEDFFSSDLMDAYSCLGNIIGEETDEDLFDMIFSKFCMGK